MTQPQPEEKPVRWQFYCKTISGFFPLSRNVRDGVQISGGMFETDKPEVIAAALRDYNGPKKYIEMINVDGEVYTGQTLANMPPPPQPALLSTVAKKRVGVKPRG